MAVFGLIGFPLSHSFSPEYFREKIISLGLQHEYKLFPLAAIEDLTDLLNANSEILGLNVTHPYKKAVIPFCHSLDDYAVRCNSVNTLLINRKSGTPVIEGYNTDYIGFKESYLKVFPSLPALILGNGGVSGTIQTCLTDNNISFTLVSRRQGSNALNWDELQPGHIKSHKVIINTTTLGMYPDLHLFPPLYYDEIGKDHYLYDLIYNPRKTLFLSRGENNGAFIKNAFDMLKIQADLSWEIWKKFIPSYC